METAVDAQTSPEPTQHTKDFGFLPIPRRLRRDANDAPSLPLYLNIAFGIGATMTAANLYYCQPLLEEFRVSFPVSESRIASIPTLTQSGYAAGLLLVSPLGDLLRRRQLLLLLLTLSSGFALAMALAPSLPALQAFSFILGFVTVTPQVLIPLAADLAPANRRAQAISIVLSGLLLGLLFARVLAGVMGQFASTGSGKGHEGWRTAYYLAFSVQIVTLVCMYFILPDFPAKNRGSGLTYWGILRTMGKFLITEPILLQGCFIMFFSSAVFSSFWVTLTFLLSGSPYHYNSLDIGLFGLIGMLGVITAPFVGRLIDGMLPWMGTLISIFILLISQVVEIAGGGINISAVVITCFVLDVSAQMQQISLASSIYAIEPAARARLNAVMIISIFLGQVMGTAAGTAVYQKAGWRAQTGLSLGFVGLMFFFLLIRGPHCSRYTWFGWQGGYSMRKPAPLTAQDAEAAEKSEQADPEKSEKVDGVDVGVADAEERATA